MPTITRTRSNSMGSVDHANYKAITEQDGDKSDFNSTNSSVCSEDPDANPSEWSKEFIGEMQIIASLIFFGASFVCQRQAMLNNIKPISYNACRFTISTALLYLYRVVAGIKLHDEKASRRCSAEEVKAQQSKKWRDLLTYGGTLGMTNLGGSLLQQIGLVTVTAGRTGFITGMYVIFVPIAEHFAPCYHAKLGWSTIIAAGVSMLGLYLLSGCAEQDTCFGGAVGEGEGIVFLSMLFWVGSILASDVGSKRVDAISLTLLEFVITSVFTILLAVWLEPDQWVSPYSAIRNNWLMITIVGFTEGMAFALSTLGQTHSSPSRAALLYSLEAVVCAICAYIFLGETLSWVEITGGFLMFLAAVGTSTSAVESDDVSDEEAKKPIMVHHDSFGSVELNDSHLQP